MWGDSVLSKRHALNRFSSERGRCAANFAVSNHRFVGVGQSKDVSIKKIRNFLGEPQYSTGKAAGSSDKAQSYRRPL